MIGESVGPYEIVREMGRGAMGVVYRARHAAQNREFALKFLESGASDPERRAVFLEKGQAAARMSPHPGLVTIHDVGEHDGIPYWVMDIVEGRSLAPIARDGELTPLEACQIMMKAARAMHAAHQAGVMHADLKPSNILLADSRMPRITDLGFAKRCALDEAAARLTGRTEVYGTPCYMAPERLRGAPPSPAADVYALGATLYELCTTEPALERGSLTATVQAVLGEMPIPPSRVNRSVTPPLQAVILTCLAKAPEDRYPSAEFLGDDLERVLRDEPVQAQASGRLARAHHRAVRHPMLVALVVLVAGLALLWGLRLAFGAG